MIPKDAHYSRKREMLVLLAIIKGDPILRSSLGKDVALARPKMPLRQGRRQELLLNVR